MVTARRPTRITPACKTSVQITAFIPPYSKVKWGNGFNTNYQVNATPPFVIDSETGIITGVPTSIGQYVFGVAVKEKLKAIKENVDVLTLTATPIPRTLQFSLMAARDLSVIKTPPPIKSIPKGQNDGTCNIHQNEIFYRIK